IAYRFHDGGQRLYRISYCDRCSNKRCNNCLTGWEVLSLRANTIVGMAVSKPGGDILNASYLEVGVSSCWDPDGTPFACGTPDNPSITMNTTIPLPSVSTN
ncbi:MAG: hypothetical protein NC920_06180, partial [Candidatus Omnitrophica bacterium]|nr:hypothetical protein [Candidatus Omnitrophota bacterium]